MRPAGDTAVLASPQGMKAFGVTAVLCALASTAVAGPSVIVVQTRDAPALPSLATQLALHAPQVSVELRAEPEADPLTFAGRAAQLVAGDDRIVIWIARVGDGYLVFAAGPWPDRALIELVRIDASVEPTELERTLALKIAGLAEALETLRTARPGPIDVAPVVSVDPPRRWVIEVAGGLARDRHERGTDPRTTLGVGWRWRRGDWSATASVVAYWQPSGTITGEHGRVSVTELGVGVAPELARDLGRGSLFGRATIGVAALRARGESEDGRIGTATLAGASTGLAIGARLHLSPSAEIGLSLGAEVASPRRGLLVDQEVVVDAGRLRLTAALTLTVTI